MKIGIISDTHDNLDNVQKSVELFKAQKVSVVFHAGDYVDPEIVRSFSGIKLIGILGNNDLDRSGLSKAFEEIGGQMKGEICEIEEEGIKFVIYHGTNPKLKNSLIESGRYDVIICGHTHKIENRNVGRTLVLNPGTANGWIFGYKATVAIFDTQTRCPEFMNL